MNSIVKCAPLNIDAIKTYLSYADVSCFSFSYINSMINFYFFL